MADQFITELDEQTTFTDDDLLVVENAPGGTPETMYMTISNWITSLFRRENYRITRTVASNNLTVAVKDCNSADASTTKALWFKIGGVDRKLTAALSVTVNAGANSFNLGATELKNTRHDLFVYVGWRASTSTIFIIISRICHAREYADFSSTATAETYGAYSGAAPAATDPVEVIGRVSVQNSGTGAFNWSIPSADVIVHRHTDLTPWLDFVPTPTGFSADPGAVVGRYKIHGASVTFFVRQTNNGTSNATTFTLALPFTAKTITNMVWGGAGVVVDNGVIQTSPGLLRVQSAATTMEVFKDFATGAFTNSGSKRLSQMNPMMYEIG